MSKKGGRGRIWHIKGYLPQSYKLPVYLEEPGLGEAGKGDRKGSVDPRLEWVWWANCSPQWTQTLSTEGWLSGEQNAQMRSCGGWKSLLPAFAFISGYLHAALLLISVSCIVYLNVRIISDTLYHSTVLSLILLQISHFFADLAIPRSSPSHRTFVFLVFFDKHAFFFSLFVQLQA